MQGNGTPAASCFGLVHELRDVYSALGPPPARQERSGRLQCILIRPGGRTQQRTQEVDSEDMTGSAPLSSAGRPSRKRPLSGSKASGTESISPIPDDSRRRRASAVKAEALIMEQGAASNSQDEEDDEEAYDTRLFHLQFPERYELDFANAIFKLGLKGSSPKVLMEFMPCTDSLTTEHIKSHLQKYRLHQQRSRGEFNDFYTQHIKGAFTAFCARRGWEEASPSHQSAGGAHGPPTGEGGYGDEVSAPAPSSGGGLYEDDGSQSLRHQLAVSHGLDLQWTSQQLDVGVNGDALLGPDAFSFGSMLPQMPPNLGMSLPPEERQRHLLEIQLLTTKILQGQLQLQADVQAYITTQLQLQSRLVQHAVATPLLGPTEFGQLPQDQDCDNHQPS